MNKWQTKVMLLSAGVVLAVTGTVALANDSTSTGLEVTGTPVTLQAAAGSTDLQFDSVSLSDLSHGAAERTVTLDPGTFQVTNYTGTDQSWTLLAGITDFHNTITGKQFDGNIKFSDTKFGTTELHPATDGSLVASARLAEGKMTFSDYVWKSDKMTVTLTVPPTVGLGSYQARIQYLLQNGVVSE